MTRRSSAHQGFISLLAVVALSGLVVGVIGIFTAKKLASLGIPFVSQIAEITQNVVPEPFKKGALPKPKSSDRKSGDAKFTSEGVVDTPYIDDGVTGVDIYRGGVVTRTLKSGIAAYFIIPPGEGRLSYAEIAEFSKLPTSSAHIPLYTTYGNGINVAVEGKIVDRAYLVFDFSKGKKLTEFKKLAKYINYCDFSTEHFQPEICAGLLRVPIDQTSNKTYLAASPKHVKGERVTKETVVYLEPTYFLGTDDVLVVEITRDTMVIPQPVTQELLADLLSDARLGGSDYSDEFMDVLRLSQFKPNLSGLVGNFDTTPLGRWGTVRIGFKAYFVTRYINSLYKRADAVVKNMPQAAKEQLFGGWGVPDFAADVAWLDTDAQKNLEDLYTEWGLVGNYRPGVGSVVGAASLRRAYEAKVKGSADVLLAVLRKTKETIAKHREEVEDTVPAEMDLLYAVEVGKVLTGKLRYEKPKSLFGNLYVLPALSVLPRVHAQTGGDGGRPPPDVSDDDQAPPPSSLYPPTEEENVETEEEIDEVEAEIEQEVKETLELIEAKLKVGELSLKAIEKALEVYINEFTEEAWKEFEKALEEAMKKADTNDQKGEVLKYCQRYYAQLSPAMQKKCKEHEDLLVYILCYVDKLPPLSLANFAKQHDIQIKCRGSDGKDEPEKPPPQGLPPPEYEPPEPPLEPIEPNNQPPLEPIE